MKLKSIFYLMIYALLVSAGHILQKMVINAGVDKFVFAFIRIAVGLCIISSLLLYRKHKPKNIIQKHYRHFLVLGIGFSGLGILMKLWGLQYTSATNASFIMSLSSATVILFAAIFLNERVGKGFYMISFLMIAGIYLVSTGGEMLVPQKGDMIIFALAFLIGAMRVYGKQVLKTLSVLETAFGRSLFGSFFLFILIWIFSPDGFSTIRDIKTLLLVMSNGITFSGSILFFYKALQLEGASNSGMFALLVPVITLFLGWGILGETVNLYQIIGGMIILIGSFFISRVKIKQANF